ncbi:MAG TPA: PAS domain-containing protein, partial [Flavitalea sp.]|nr:PAS domain-containing protein [Flavitalea sp.]
MSLLTGGGETGKLIRAHDWSDSSLGTPDQWPQSLKTTLSIILHSRFPMFLFWGREHICFYNDAYRPSLGNNGKHPDAIGRKGHEVWPEIWDFIKPLIDQAMISGEATWHENQLLPIFRNGQMEDVYWTFSYSPVNDESGSHAGVLVTCTETTNSVLALTSMRESEQRFKNLINQATVGVVVLMGKELKIEVANDKYCELIHKPRQMLIGRGLFDVHPEAEEEFRPVIEEVLLTGRELHLSENTSWIKQDEEQLPVYMNLTYQPYKELDGKISGVIVLVTDVTEQVNALRKIAFEEERSRLAIDSAELGVFEVELQSDRMLSNPRFDALFGFSQPVTRNEYAASLIPEDLPVRNSAIEKALESGNLAYEVRVKWKDGSIHWIKVSG